MNLLLLIWFEKRMQQFSSRSSPGWHKYYNFCYLVIILLGPKRLSSHRTSLRFRYDFRKVWGVFYIAYFCSVQTFSRGLYRVANLCKIFVTDTFGAELLFQTRYQKLEDNFSDVPFQAKFGFLSEQNVSDQDNEQRRPWNKHLLLKKRMETWLTPQNHVLKAKRIPVFLHLPLFQAKTLKNCSSLEFGRYCS